MGTFSKQPNKGWKKVKYSKQDGTKAEFYAAPDNTPADIQRYKRGQERVAINESLKKKLPGSSNYGTRSEIGTILAPHPKGSGGPVANVKDLIKRLNAKREKERRNK